ncbi:MAG: dTDP-4-dehydrorhamnose reductase [Muribaculaceae bacterium]
MKILVTGCNGQLGRELREVLESTHPGITTYTDIDELDLCDRAAVQAFLDRGDFSHVVNCAAYTAVDKAEEQKKECAAANIDAITNLAYGAQDRCLKILHISTDYVFDGTAHRPYTENDKVNPLSHYGTTKRKGETALLGLAPDSVVIRTAWLYAPDGHNFVNTMLRLARTEGHVSVVSDQIGTPTYARDLAEAICTILFSRQWVSGIFNFSNEGVCSWYDFAKAIFEIADVSCEVTPISTDDYRSAAPRPYYSVLDKGRIRATYGIKIPYWRDSLRHCINRIKDK